MDVREKLVELIDDALQREEETARVVGKRYVNTIADHLISHGVTVQEWISVKDRLPRNFSTVIGYEPGNRIGEVNYENKEFEWADDEKVSFITHWMPLPQPPKGE